MSFSLHGRSYSYIKRLGSGGKAVVHLVRGDNNMLYAAKVSTDLHPEMVEEMLAEDPNFKGPFTSREQIEEEARIMNFIRTKLYGRYFSNFVYYVDSATLPSQELPTAMRNQYNEDVAVIIESYVDGPTIQGLFDEGAVLDVFKVITDILSALYTLRSVGANYLDLADENVMYDSISNNFVLIDFDDVVVRDVAFVGTIPGYEPPLGGSYKSSPLDFLLELLIGTYATEVVDPRFEQFRLATKEIDEPLFWIKTFSQLFPERDVIIHARDGDITYRNGEVVAEVNADTLIPNLDYEETFRVIRDRFKAVGVTLSPNTSYQNYHRLESALTFYQKGTVEQKRIAKEILSRYHLLKNYSSPADLKGVSVSQLMSMLPTLY